MDENRLIQNIKTLSFYQTAMEKLTVNPSLLNDDEKTFLLTVAVILLRKYASDHRYTSFVELAHYIILRYSLYFGDYAPLYDFSVNIGHYPVAQAITDLGYIQPTDIPTSIIPSLINEKFKYGDIVETYLQKNTRDNILKSSCEDICYVAPTSFGKSSIILDHIASNETQLKKFAIIVPTKSLLAQTYKAVRARSFNVKIIIHDEMYNGEDRFIAVLTQERALRLLDKHNIYFDCLYIDEAHLLLGRNHRSILLSRLIRANRKRMPQTKAIYLSPLVSNVENLKIMPSQNIYEQRIIFNLKEPEYYEYCTDGKILKYNRFTDAFFRIGSSEGMFEYILQHATRKTFCYLYTPRKIEQFAEALSEELCEVPESDPLKEAVQGIKDYVHDDFYAIDFLKKGIVYLHGKMPDNVKEYLEYKFSQIPELQYLVANRVVLEGINLPITSLFILNGTNLHGKDLTNLIGRVNRLNLVFAESPKLELLMPQIHFVNNDQYNRKNGNFENKMRLLKSSMSEDNVKNPVLASFSFEEAEKNRDNVEKCREIINDENFFFSDTDNPVQELKHRMISLGINTIYNISDSLCQMILEKISRIVNHPKLHDTHFLDRLRYVFIRHFDEYIIDDEFRRLKNDKAIAYYKMYFENRSKSLKENIAHEVAYFNRRIAEGESLLYIGDSYGERPYAPNGRNVYIDLEKKNNRQLVNIAIIKQKIEEDFVSFKLRMFFQLMFDYSILNQDEYYQVLYGTTNQKKISLVRTGLTINLINRLEKDDQLKNINLDNNGHLITNAQFETYRDSVDDFYRFELSRFL